MSVIKYIVYNHVLEILFSSGPATITAENIASSLDKQTEERVRTFVHFLILEIRNRLPSLPLTKETLNRAPFGILPAFRHILQKYESIIAENQELTSGPQTSEPQTSIAQQEQPIVQELESLSQRQRRPRKKKKPKKGNDSNQKRSNNTQFQAPRLFSLFPGPSLKWRFIKIDSQNVNGVFGRSISPRQPKEKIFDYGQRCFFEFFNFRKLGINR